MESTSESFEGNEFRTTGAISAEDNISKGHVRSNEEAMAALRRENFRLSLMCYNLTKAYKRSANPHDVDSSLLYSVEAENLSLKEALKAKQELLSAASKMIDALKEENDSFEEQIKELTSRIEANELEWREKYDILAAELERSKQVIRKQESHLLTQENEAARQNNTLQNRISELQQEVDASQAELKRKQLEISVFQSEADRLRAALEQVNSEQPFNDSELVLDQVSRDLRASCECRVQEVAAVVHMLVKQITDAGLVPVANISPGLLCDQADHDIVGRAPLAEIKSSNESPRSVPLEKDTRSASPQLNPSEFESTNTSSSVAYLSQRLNAARRLILDLGNEKLKQDKLLSRMRLAHENEISALKENCRSMELQLQKQKQTHGEELARRDSEIQRLHQRVAELLHELDGLMIIRERMLSDLDDGRKRIERMQQEQLDLQTQLTKLSATGLISPITIDPLPYYGGSESSVIDVHTNDLLNCTPASDCLTPDLRDPRSLSGLRNLYDLVHGLKLQLDNVRFTQHSFVDMINRSLSTAGLDGSFNISPTKRLPPAHSKSIQASFSFAVLPEESGLENQNIPPVPNGVEVSSANATYGGVDTLGENMHSCFSEKSDAKNDADKSIGLNQTVAELRSYPPSPPSRGRSVDAKKPSKDVLGAKYNRLQLPRLKRLMQLHSNSLREEVSHRAEVPVSLPQTHSASFTAVEDGDGPEKVNWRIKSGSASVGDLTMMEWQSKDVFERLMRATAKLRDVLEECAEVSAELWNGDASQCFSFLMSNELERTHLDGKVGKEANEAGCTTGARSEMQISEPQCQSELPVQLVQNHSVRFDGPDLSLRDLAFTPSSAEASLSQLYGSAWKTSEVRRPGQCGKQRPREPSVVAKRQCPSDKAGILLRRFVTLLTEAMLRMREAICSTETSDNLSTSETFEMNKISASSWLISWVDSASHWFSSYVDSMTPWGATLASEVEIIDAENVESLLECLERVFSEHITDLVEDVRKRFLLVDTKLKESEEQQKTLDSKIAEMGISLKQITAEKCDLQAKVDALRRFEHSSDDFHSPAHELHETNQKGAMQITPYQTSDKSGTSSPEESVAVMSGMQKEHEEISKMIESCGLYFPEGSTVKTIITTLLREYTQAKNKTTDLQEQSEILRNQLDESVPQADHQRALDRVRTLEISLEQNDEVIESLKEQAACAIDQFRTLHISPASSDLNGYIDAVVEELTISRKTIEHLEHDKQEAHALLDASVPKDCYDEIAKLLESSRLELNETHGSLKKLQLELDDISNSLCHVVDVSSNQSLHEKVDLVVSEMLEQRSLVEKMDSDHQAFILFLESISNDPLPDTFEECLNVLKAFIFDHQAEVEHLTADRDQILTLLENSGLGAQNDGPLVDRLQSAISVFQERDRKLCELESVHEQLKEALQNSVPAVEYNEVKSVLASKLDELSATKENFFEAMDKVNHLTTTTISTEKHTEILSVIRDELRAKSSECEQFENERQEVISLLDSVSSDPSCENLLDRLRAFVGAYVSAKNALTATEDNYRTTFSEFQSTKEQLCSLQTELRELVENHEIELARVREDMTNKQKTDLEEKSREHALNMEALSGELEKYRTEQQKLIPKVDELQAELDKANEEIRKLRSSLTAQTEYAQAANEAAAAHEQHAKALASHLDSLKLEHGKCPTRLDLVDAQTSPVRISFTPDSPLGHENGPSTAPPTSKQDGRTSSARLKKYEELKTVAFEIKEKLIQRTNQLEASFAETARLRSVIRQNKEQASRAVEEVENLRSQAIRKNKRILELEAELSKLKGSHLASRSMDARSASGQSAVRLTSDLENPRAHGLSETIGQISSLIGSVTNSLLECPITPVASSAIQPDSPPDLDSVGSDLCSTHNISGTTFGKPVTQISECSEADASVACSVLERALAEVARLRSGIQLDKANVNNVIRELEKQRGESIRKIWSRVSHYFDEMDKICSDVVSRWPNRTCEPVFPRPVTIDELKALVVRSLGLVQGVRRRVNAFFEALEISGDITAQKVESDLSIIASLLSMGKPLNEKSSADCSLPSSTEDKENRSPADRPTEKQKRLLRRAQAYRRRYHELARGLDNMAKDLTETTDVLLATRANLERNAGLSTLPHTPKS